MIIAGHTDLIPCPAPGCFLCREIVFRERIRWLMHPAVAGSVANRERAHAKMVVPVVLEICSLAPKLLDASWVTTLPPRRPPFRGGDDKIRAMLYDICILLQRKEAVDVSHMHCLLLSMKHIMWDRYVIPLSTRNRLRIQIHEMRNTDVVRTDILRFVAVADPKPQDLDAIVYSLAAAIPEALRVVEGVQNVLGELMCKVPRLTRNGRAEFQRRYDAMETLRRHLDANTYDKRRLALAMALHTRLGAGSGMQALSAELVVVVLGHCEEPALIKYSLEFFQ